MHDESDASPSALRDGALAAIEQAGDLAALDRVRVRYLGRQGLLTARLKALSELPVDARRDAGQTLNALKRAIGERVAERRERLERAAYAARMAVEPIDVSLPGRGRDAGSVHPINLVTERIEAFFAAAGFARADGPEVEDDRHNFSALNFPPKHPARAMHDTFYIGDDGWLLRTHTSSVQVRVMEHGAPPVRIICPGRVYRRDSDRTHTPVFHQVEGLLVDRSVNFVALKTIIERFLRAFFEDEALAMRFRPSYFPFTEPSAEADIQCVECRGARRACPVCKGSGWLEVLGCGLVHPKVLGNCGLDPDAYSGYAFGMGVERLAMLRYGIDDLRVLYDNDVRFLAQFEQ